MELQETILSYRRPFGAPVGHLRTWALQDFPSFDVRQKDVVFVYENTHLEHFSAKVAPGSYFLRPCVAHPMIYDVLEPLCGPPDNLRAIRGTLYNRRDPGFKH